MGRIRLSLRNLSVTDKLAKGRHIVGSLTNNPAFATLSPPPAEVTSLLDELDKVQAAVQAVRAQHHHPCNAHSVGRDVLRRATEQSIVEVCTGHSAQLRYQTMISGK